MRLRRSFFPLNLWWKALNHMRPTICQVQPRSLLLLSDGCQVRIITILLCESFFIWSISYSKSAIFSILNASHLKIETVLPMFRKYAVSPTSLIFRNSDCWGLFDFCLRFFMQISSLSTSRDVYPQIVTQIMRDFFFTCDQLKKTISWIYTPKS